MEKVDRKSPNPKMLDIQKKPDRKWVLVCVRKQILTTQVLADTNMAKARAFAPMELIWKTRSGALLLTLCMLKP